MAIQIETRVQRGQEVSLDRSETSIAPIVTIAGSGKAKSVKRDH